MADLDIPLRGITDVFEDEDEIPVSLLLDGAEVPLRARGDRTPEQVEDAEAELFFALLEELPSGIPNRQKRLIRRYEVFLEAHRKCDALRSYQVDGRERIKINFVARLVEYMTFIVKNSTVKDSASGEVVIDDRSGHPVRMVPDTLYTITTELIGMLRFAPYPSMNAGERREAADLLHQVGILLAAATNTHQHRRHLVTIFHLLPLDHTRLVLSIESVRHLLEVHYTHYLDTKPEQTHLLILSFLFTGCRGSSLLSDARYPDEFLRWRDLIFFPKHDDKGELSGFGVEISVRHWKGHHDGQKLVIKFQLEPVQQEQSLLLDIGSVFIATAIYRGLFYGTNFNEFVAHYRDMDRFQVLPEHMSEPVFLSRKAGQSAELLPGVPLLLNKANEHFQDSLSRAGLQTGRKFSDTLYALRRTFATIVATQIGRARARFFLGHTGSSVVLEKVYDQSYASHDLTGVLQGDKDATVDRGPLRQAERITPLTAAQVFEEYPQFLHVRSKREFAELCLSYDSRAWREVEPYRTILCRKSLILADVVVSLRREERRIIRLIQRIHHDKESLNAVHQRDFNRYSRIRARASRSPEAEEEEQALRASLEDQERGLLEYGASSTDSSDDVDPSAQESVQTSINIEALEQEAEQAAAAAPAETRRAVLLELESIDDPELEMSDNQGDTTRDADRHSQDPPAAQPRSGPSQRAQETAAENDVASEVSQAEASGHSGGSQEGHVSFSEQLNRETAMSWLKTLIGHLRPEFLEEGVAEAPDQGSGDDRGGSETQPAPLPQPSSANMKFCHLCLSDPTAEPKWKTREWKKTATTKFERHLHQYHSDYDRGIRWIKQGKQGDSWHCPVCSATIPWHMPSARRHVRQSHNMPADSALYYAISDLTYKEAEAKKKAGTSPGQRGLSSADAEDSDSSGHQPEGRVSDGAVEEADEDIGSRDRSAGRFMEGSVAQDVGVILSAFLSPDLRESVITTAAAYWDVPEATLDLDVGSEFWTQVLEALRSTPAEEAPTGESPESQPIDDAAIGSDL